MQLLKFAMLTKIVFSILFMSTMSKASETSLYLPEFNLTVKERVTFLAIDDRSLQNQDNLTLTLNTPEVRQAPVLKPEWGNEKAPDSMASHFYGTVLYDQGKYRMWYYSVSLRAKPYDLKQGPVCYAESNDGIQWTKPNLGQVEINGSTENNAVKLSDEMTQCAAVIIDEDEPDPDSRYKMVYMVLADTWVFRTATSADGIHWNVPDNHPTEKFLEMGSFYKFNDRYIVHGQGSGKNDAGEPEGRQGYASTSTNFREFEQVYHRAFRLPEPEDEKLRGLVGDYPQVHLGIGATSYGNVAVGLYGIWHNPPAEKRRKTGWYGAGLISCDLGLVVSNDGVYFREPVKDNVFISGNDSPVTPVPGVDDPTILCQANGILNVGEQTLIYHGRWRNATISGQDYYAEVALATLPRDRWGSLGLADGKANGTVLTSPITVPKDGCNIFLNAEAAKKITVELTDEDGDLLSAYSGKHQGNVKVSNSLDNPVVWSDRSLKQLAGKTIRIKLGIQDNGTKLFAVYVDAANKP